MLETVQKTDCRVNDLHSALEAGSRCSIIDVREYAEFASGRIPGSVSIPLSEIERRSKEMDSENTVYVVCRTGRRSTEAQRKLKSMGFTDARSVEGGLNAWRKAGFPVERDEGAPWSLERQVRFAAGGMVMIGVLLSALVAQPFVWIAGFVGAGLVFAAVTDTCAMGMLLSRLPWNRDNSLTAKACPPEKVG